MDPLPVITVTLDRPRAIKWTRGADARLGSLDRPPSLSDLSHRNGRKAFYALAACLWAALVERDAKLPDPEAVADHLATDEAQAAAFEALLGAFRAAGVIEQKKTTAAASTSSNGPSALSSSA